MSTRRLNDLKRRVAGFEALDSKEKRKKKKEASRKLDALMDKIEVERICTDILKKLELMADMGIASYEVMVIDEAYVKRGWSLDLFKDVPVEALKDEVAYKVYLRLQHMGLRPRLVLDSYGENSNPVAGGDVYRLIVSWR